MTSAPNPATKPGPGAKAAPKLPEGLDIAALAFSVAGVVIAALAGWMFLAMHEPEPIVSGPGVTDRKMLSDFVPELKGSPADTPVFVLKGAEPGGTFMIMGGTHPLEIAGLMAAIVMVENATVRQGTIIVVPQANRSGFTHTEPMEGFPHVFTIDTPGGQRWFRLGMRLANPAHQWPDPEIYYQPSEGEGMVGHETRNLNRNHPGNVNGTLTGKASYGLVTLAQQQMADMVLDLHEAPPENPLSNMLIVHELAIETAATAQFFMSSARVRIDLQKSPTNLHGLSHREFGDFAGIQAMLAESVSPAMGQLRGRMSQDLVVGGKDPNYVAAYQMDANRRPGAKILYSRFDENGSPLAVRVARHLATIASIIEAYSELNPRDRIVVNNIPSYADMIAKGLGAFLLPPPAGSPAAPNF